MAKKEKKLLSNASNKPSPPVKVNNKSSKKKKNVVATNGKKKKKGIGSKIVNILLALVMLLGIGLMGCIVVFCVYVVKNAPEFDTDLLYSTESSIFYDKNGHIP